MACPEIKSRFRIRDFHADPVFSGLLAKTHLRRGNSFVIRHRFGRQHTRGVFGFRTGKDGKVNRNIGGGSPVRLHQLNRHRLRQQF